MRGGFTQWVESDLPVDDEADDYQASLLGLAEDNLQLAATTAIEALEPLKEPKNAALALAAGGVAVYGAANYHTTLQFIGTFGVLLTVAKKVGKGTIMGCNYQIFLTLARWLNSNCAFT